MDFSVRLKTLRLDRGYTQRELGRIAGITDVAIGNLERGVKKPSLDTAIALGSALSISIDELLGVHVTQKNPTIDFILSRSEKKLLENFRRLDANGKDIVLTLCKMEADRGKIDRYSPSKNIDKIYTSDRYIPKYSTPSAAGTAVQLDGEDFEMMLVDDSVPADADYAVGIHGDSMAPYIHDGDTVFVKKTERISIGDIGIFSVDGAMYCKQYYVDDNRNLILISANPELRDTNIFIGTDSDHTVMVCGVVLLDKKVKLPDYLFEKR